MNRNKSFPVISKMLLVGQTRTRNVFFIDIVLKQYFENLYIIVLFVQTNTHFSYYAIDYWFFPFTQTEKFQLSYVLRLFLLTNKL